MTTEQEIAMIRSQCLAALNETNLPPDEAQASKLAAKCAVKMEGYPAFDSETGASITAYRPVVRVVDAQGNVRPHFFDNRPMTIAEIIPEVLNHHPETAGSHPGRR